ncbi:hypothetical protein BT69DRAFT_1316088 [Atractiella rhizophila]|nr:hypothetical protein BT69DRAFT_1316088 [Atractiella rhizophila]
MSASWGPINSATEKFEIVLVSFAFALSSSHQAPGVDIAASLIGMIECITSVAGSGRTKSLVNGFALLQKLLPLFVMNPITKCGDLHSWIHAHSLPLQNLQEAWTDMFVLMEEKEQINQILLVQPVDRSLRVNTQELHAYGRQLAFTGTCYKGFQLALLLPSVYFSKLGSADSLKAVANVQHACPIAGCIDDGFEMVKHFTF